MAPKVDQKTFDKIMDLKTRYGLTNAVLAERFGISERTVRVFTRAARTGTRPYHPGTKLEDLTEITE